MKNNHEHNKCANNSCYFSFLNNSLVYLSITNKIKSCIINDCVRDSDECPWYDEECPNSMAASVVYYILIL